MTTHDIRCHKHFPTVCLAWTFPHFVQTSLSDEVGHDLLHELSKDGEQHENSEELILQTLLRVIGFEKRETDEKGGQSAECDFGINVGRRSPVLLEDTLSHFSHLSRERCRELFVEGRVFLFTLVVLRFARKCSLHLGQFLSDGGSFRATKPSRVPIDIGVGTGSCSDDREHPFRRVLTGWARVSSVSFKVGSKNLTLFANFTKVNRLTSLCEEK